MFYVSFESFHTRLHFRIFCKLLYNLLCKAFERNFSLDLLFCTTGFPISACAIFGCDLLQFSLTQINIHAVFLKLWPDVFLENYWEYLSMPYFKISVSVRSATPCKYKIFRNGKPCFHHEISLKSLGKSLHSWKLL